LPAAVDPMQSISAAGNYSQSITLQSLPSPKMVRHSEWSFTSQCMPWEIKMEKSLRFWTSRFERKHGVTKGSPRYCTQSWSFPLHSHSLLLWLHTLLRLQSKLSVHSLQTKLTVLEISPTQISHFPSTCRRSNSSVSGDRNIQLQESKSPVLFYKQTNVSRLETR
jgi:hypothetical protein